MGVHCHFATSGGEILYPDWTWNIDNRSLKTPWQSEKHRIQNRPEKHWPLLIIEKRESFETTINQTSMDQVEGEVHR